MNKIRSEISVRRGRLSDLDSVMTLEAACFEPGVRETAEFRKADKRGSTTGFRATELENQG